MNDRDARGLENILIASIDGLKDFPEAIAQVFPKTEIQLCIVHQIRNSLKNKLNKEQKPFMADLKLMPKLMYNWNQLMHNWTLIISQLQIFFAGPLNWALS